MENLQMELGLVLLLGGLAFLAATDAQSQGTPAKRHPAWVWWALFASAGLMGLAGGIQTSSLLSLTVRLVAQLAILWATLAVVRHFRSRLPVLGLRRQRFPSAARHLPATFLLLAVSGLVVVGWLGRPVKPSSGSQSLVAVSSPDNSDSPKNAAAKPLLAAVAQPSEPPKFRVSYSSRRWAKALPILMIMVGGVAVAAAASAAAERRSRAKPLAPGGQTSR